MYISSDTNIWIDFECIGCLKHPFLLDNDYFLSDITYHDELNQSEKIKNMVNDNKLKITTISSKEMFLANKLSNIYSEISFNDSIALSIAISRNWILLTGDNNLRDAAKKESVICHGTIWIYDELTKNNLLTKNELLKALNKLLIVSKKGRRLPVDEIEKRIKKLTVKNGWYHYHPFIFLLHISMYNL